MKSIEFNHQSSAYEVRIITIGPTTLVRAFHNGRPANRFRYAVNLSVAVGFQRKFGFSVIHYLVGEAMRDITEG